MATTSEDPIVLFSDELGTEIVSMIVGTGIHQKEFNVHKKLLCDKIPFFKNMFKGLSIKGQTRLRKLPEDNPVAFRQLFGWVYYDTIQLPKTGASIEGHVDLWILADKYFIPDLADTTMSALLKILGVSDLIPKPARVLNIYQRTTAGSKLRLLMSKLLAYAHSTFKDDFNDGIWSIGAIVEAFLGNTELMMDFLTHGRNQSGVSFSDPRLALPCIYHQHGEGKPCPSAEKKIG